MRLIQDSAIVLYARALPFAAGRSARGCSLEETGQRAEVWRYRRKRNPKYSIIFEKWFLNSISRDNSQNPFWRGMHGEHVSEILLGKALKVYKI